MSRNGAGPLTLSGIERGNRATLLAGEGEASRGGTRAALAQVTSVRASGGREPTRAGRERSQRGEGLIPR